MNLNRRAQNLLAEALIIFYHTAKLNITPGPAPSVKKISFGSAGKLSRASIPATMVSRNPLIPCCNSSRRKVITYKIKVLSHSKEAFVLGYDYMLMLLFQESDPGFPKPV